MTSSTISPSAASWLGFGFWVVALAFTTAMAFTTVPTPLWSLYAQRDRFSSLTVTVAFAVYAVAVAFSLFVAGHCLGLVRPPPRADAGARAGDPRRAWSFLVWPALPGLLLARVLSGLGVGAVTATATAWMSELYGADQPARADRRDELPTSAVSASAD